MRPMLDALQQLLALRPPGRRAFLAGAVALERGDQRGGRTLLRYARKARKQRELRALADRLIAEVEIAMAGLEALRRRGAA